MNEEEKMFNWGIAGLMLVLMLTAVLQVCFRVQDKTRARIRADIVKTQQEIAVAETNFAAYVRPEILRNIVNGLYPKSEPLGFNKTINIQNLPVNNNQ